MFLSLLTDRRSFIKRLISLPESSAKKRLVSDLVGLCRLSDWEVVDSLVHSWFEYNYGCSPVRGVLIPRYLFKQVGYSREKFFSFISDLYKILVNKSSN